VRLLEGKVALVTGAARGIGSAISEAYAEHGARVVCGDVLLDQVRAVACGIQGAAVLLDVGEPESGRQAVETTVSTFGRLDILVNNAGATWGAPAEDHPLEAWDKLVNLNMTGTFLISQRVAKKSMIPARWGRIVNVASVAGLVPSPPGHTLYGASKSFLVKFSQALAAEVRAYGVHVTALCPGFTFSEFHDVAGTRGQVRQLPSFMWMDAATVARQGVDAVEAGEVIYVNGPVNWTLATLAKYAPDWLTEAVILRNSGKFRKV